MDNFQKKILDSFGNEKRSIQIVRSDLRDV